MLINYNDALVDLRGLEGLERVGGLLKISENDGLTSLAALAAVSSVGGLSLFDDPSLVELGLFAPSVDLVADASGHIELTLMGLPALTDLGGLGHVAEVVVTGQLHISVESNALLADVAGLAAFFPPDAAPDLQLRDLPALTALQLDGAADIGELDIAGTPSLASLEGLADLVTAESISIDDAPALASLAGLDNLSVVTGRFSLGGCGGGPEPDDSVLSSLEALASLEKVGRFEITDQSALVGLAGLST